MGDLGLSLINHFKKVFISLLWKTEKVIKPTGAWLSGQGSFTLCTTPRFDSRCLQESVGGHT